MATVIVRAEPKITVLAERVPSVDTERDSALVQLDVPADRHAGLVFPLYAFLYLGPIREQIRIPVQKPPCGRKHFRFLLAHEPVQL